MSDEIGEGFIAFESDYVKSIEFQHTVIYQWNGEFAYYSDLKYRHKERGFFFRMLVCEVL